MLKRLYLLIILHMGCITLTFTILDLLRIKVLWVLRLYAFTSPYTLHNFVTEKFLMTLPYRRIYVKKSLAASGWDSMNRHMSLPECKIWHISLPQLQHMTNMLVNLINIIVCVFCFFSLVGLIFNLLQLN
jgi:hypothetical protein